MKKKVFDDINKLPKNLENTVVCIGNFDGVHLGHHDIIKNTIAQAKKLNAKSFVITFSPHPQQVFNKEFKSIMSTEEKVSKIQQEFNDLDGIIVLDFNEYASITYPIFIEHILKKALKCIHFVCGKKFRFGHKALGTVQKIIDAGIEVSVIEATTYQGLEISSTVIRKYLSMGGVMLASHMLGRPYTISANISRGNRRKVSVPTLNVYPSLEMLLPRNGIYLSRIHLNGVRYNAVSSLGVAPTVTDEQIICLEVHALSEIPELIYDDFPTTVELLQYMRPERAFATIAMMCWHIEDDIKNSEYLFKNIGTWGAHIN